MIYRPVFLLFIGFMTLSMIGCESREDVTSTNSEVAASTPSKQQEQGLKSPFVEPLEPDVYELPSGALATWRNYATSKPALVLFSTHPFLDPIHTEQSVDNILQLIRSGTAEEIDQRSRLFHPDPTLIPSQTVSASIAAELFSELVVVLPTITPLEELSLDAFRRRLIVAGFLTEEEGAALTLEKGVYRGKVRGLPLRYVHPEALPIVNTPVVLHIDLGYFKDLYKNEVKTPIYDLMHQTATTIKTAGYQSIAVTLSYSNHEMDFPLESRFVISNLADILQKPEFLTKGLPENWALRSRALYFNIMFKESEARDLIAKNARVVGPEDPAAQYAFAISLFEQNRPEQGFAALDRAVALDKGYGLAYLDFAEQGAKTGRWEKSIDLLRKVVNLYPDNALFHIQQADFLISSGRGQEALPLLKKLQELPWSPLFHQHTPQLLERLEAIAIESTIDQPPSKQ